MLKLTGERVIPKLMKKDNLLLQEHLARYHFAIPYCKGKVMDLACGVGYGSQIIKSKAGNINTYIGVDIDQTSIEYAIDNYYAEGLDFFVGDALDLDLHKKLGKFDTIISFETVEHLEDDYKFIDNLLNTLKPGGRAIISTPFGSGRGKPCGNDFHYHQYTEEEFVDLLTPFTSIDMYYQRGNVVEKEKTGEKYFLMIAICEK